MSALDDALNAAFAAARSIESALAVAQDRVRTLEKQVGDQEDEIFELRAQLGAAPTELPSALPISIALAAVAKKAGLTIQQARAIFGAVTPEEAAAISRFDRDERARAAAEDASRQKKSIDAKARRS